MKIPPLFKTGLLLLCLIVTPIIATAQSSEVSEKVLKIALRDAANQLLLTQQDSTTLIAPVRILSDSLYELSFGAPISFEPSALVKSIEESLAKTDLERNYTVEVKRCDDREVVYSYIITDNTESTIVPCLDRPIKRSCYLIEIELNNSSISNGKESHSFYRSLFFGLMATICFLTVVVMIRRSKRTEIKSKGHIKVGSFSFIPDQLKLVQEAKEIALSKKECEILELLVLNSNDIVTREELTKRIWEDNGVIVGRSLDTYISKLRKKLKDDDSIKITNVHGVGYKLELLS